MEHFVHLYQETRFLADAVAEYLGESLNAGAAAIVIATPAHRAAFLERLDAEKALREGRLKLLDAEQTLTPLVRDGMPQWRPFKEIVGGMISDFARATRPYVCTARWWMCYGSKAGATRRSDSRATRTSSALAAAQHAAHRGENFQGNAGRTFANSLIRSAGSYGFATWWSKPARLARILSEACFQAVTATSTGQRSP